MNAHDLLAAWALDAVDDHERSVVERAIAADPELALEARGLRETTALLAGSVAAAPPPALRADVLAIIAREAPRSGESHPTAPLPSHEVEDTNAHPAFVTPKPRRHGVARWQSFALAAVVAGALAVPTTLAIQNDQRATQVEQQMSALESAMRQPGAQLVQGDVAGGGIAAAVLTDGEAVFTASDLPDPGDGLTYQLWRQDGDHMVSAGTLALNDGRVSATVSAEVPVDVLAVSIEPEGGSDAPTTDPVIVLAGI
ncbi:anti-sigma factor [Serinibacter arcticus]|uniref:Regulator of SigK n=1 Tax=Serinibacter arcticus TaxID=1655435 RepID=A0A4Z1E7Z7_9MICO|nr:anti-sigma factor [Serinibacter arcticus]TGO05641.1 hypothetical protein SERN_1645 [Serinibacter arcticus]